jgi:hypothetical protein
LVQVSAGRNLLLSMSTWITMTGLHCILFTVADWDAANPWRQLALNDYIYCKRDGILFSFVFVVVTVFCQTNVG